MLNNSINILDFDESIIKQKKLLSLYKNDVSDFRDIAPVARNWLNSNTRSVIQNRIKGLQKNSVTFLGSGDFHHISEILISRFDEPLTLISFDHHPDWAILPPRYGCGSWVSEVLKRKNLLKFILLGASSSDLSGFSLLTGNLRSLEENRIEIYPYAHKPSWVFLKKVPDNISLTVKRGALFTKIYWSELKDRDLKSFFYELLKRIPEKKAYVSIDKDCLKNEFALTNWEEGKFSLDELLLLLKLIKENLDIVGLDITGDYSPIKLNGVLRRIASFLDHPKKVKAIGLPEPAVTATNEEANLKILEVLIGEPKTAGKMY